MGWARRSGGELVIRNVLFMPSGIVPLKVRIPDGFKRAAIPLRLLKSLGYRTMSAAMPAITRPLTAGAMPKVLVSVPSKTRLKRPRVDAATGAWVLRRPKGITRYSNRPSLVRKAAFH